MSLFSDHGQIDVAHAERRYGFKPEVEHQWYFVEVIVLFTRR